MTFEQGRISPGHAEKYDTSEDLLRWLGTHAPSLADLAYALSHGRAHFEYGQRSPVPDIELRIT